MVVEGNPESGGTSSALVMTLTYAYHMLVQMYNTKKIIFKLSSKVLRHRYYN